MAEVTWNEAVADQVLLEAGTEAIVLAGGRVVDRAKPLTRIRTTRAPGKREAYYSEPPGRLRRSINAELRYDAQGPVVYITAEVPLGHFRNIGGKGIAAYGGTRGNNPSIWLALQSLQGETLG